MKIETIYREDDTKLTFPKLYMDHNRKFIVLFIDICTGIVVHLISNDNDICHQIGSCRKDFISCTDSEYWTPLKPGSSVTFTQD